MPAAGAERVVFPTASCASCSCSSIPAIASSTAEIATMTEVLLTLPMIWFSRTASPFCTQTASISTEDGTVTASASCSARYPAAISDSETSPLVTEAESTSDSAIASSVVPVESAGNRTATSTSAPSSSRIAGHTAVFLRAGKTALSSSGCCSAFCFLLLRARKISRTTQSAIPSAAPIRIQSQNGRKTVAAFHSQAGRIACSRAESAGNAEPGSVRHCKPGTVGHCETGAAREGRTLAFGLFRHAVL